MAAPDADLTAVVTRPLGPYRLVSRIGEGGMGVVHLALDPAGQPVAVKVLKPHVAGDDLGRARLAREVATLQRVRGAHIAEVLDADVSAAEPYIVTRYVPGPSLDSVVREHGPLSGASLLRLARALADALCTIHAAGVVHRDLKPSNVLLVEGEPVVIDFGIARVADDMALTSTGLMVGTPGYLPPEVVAGERASFASDVHTLAVTLAFAATGRPAFGTGSVEVVLDNVTSGRADLAGVDQPMAGLLRAMLATHPEVRPTAVDVRDQVTTWIARAGLGGVPTVVLPRAPAEQRGTPPTAVLPTPRDERAVVAWKPLGREPAFVAGAAGASAVACAGLAPVLTGLLVLAAAIGFRTVDGLAGLLHRRRAVRGRHWSDVPAAILASPWRLLIAVLLTSITAPIGFVLGGSVFLIVWVLTGAPATSGVALACGAAIALLVMWWGPGGGSLRRGARLTVRGTLRSRGPVLGVAFALAFLAFVVAGTTLTSGPLTWWPFGKDPTGDYGLPEGPLGSLLEQLVSPR
jgi:predicted Ser/Thr protein kinase